MTEIASAYGQALYDLASAEGLEEEILSQITVLDHSFQAEPGFISLLRCHSLTKQERCALLDESFREKIHPYVLNFLKILTEKGYIRHFSDCAAVYRKSYQQAHNILPVTAVTAIALTQEQSQKLIRKLGGLTGKRIELINQVDPGILGGVRLDYDGRRLDDTVAHRLEAVRAMLRGTVL